jgi:Derlin-2/3
MAFSLVVHGTIPKDEICGVIVGHIWYFFSDVYPSLHDGHRPLDPPMWWRRLFETAGAADRAQREQGTQAGNINNDIAAAAAAEVR